MSWSRSAERVERLRELLGPGPWTTGQLAEYGFTRSQLERDVRVGRLVRLRQGIYAVPAADVTLQSSRDGEAARLSHALLAPFSPRAAFSHRSSGLAQGVWLPFPDDALIHVTDPGGIERTDTVFRIHASRLLEVDVTTVDGLPMTTIARTAIDLARGRTFPQALVPIDSAFRLMVLGGPLTAQELRRRPDDDPLVGGRLAAARAQLEEAFGRVWSWPGTRVVRAALDQMNCRAESPYETSTRGHIVVANLPTPRVGAIVRGASGKVYFADLLWESHRLIGEADGVKKLGDDPATFVRRIEAERIRQRDLEDAGWRFVRWTAGEPPRRFIQRIARALNSFG